MTPPEQLKAIQFLMWERDEMYSCPNTREGSLVGTPSNSELRRWLKHGSVLINGTRPGPGDIVTWPIRELVYFPGAASQVTVIAT